jgi:hypothetical protein
MPQSLFLVSHVLRYSSSAGQRELAGKIDQCVLVVVLFVTAVRSSGERPSLRGHLLPKEGVSLLFRLVNTWPASVIRFDTVGAR